MPVSFYVNIRVLLDSAIKIKAPSLVFSVHGAQITVDIKIMNEQADQRQHG